MSFGHHQGILPFVPTGYTELRELEKSTIPNSPPSQFLGSYSPGIGHSPLLLPLSQHPLPDLKDGGSDTQTDRGLLRGLRVAESTLL